MASIQPRRAAEFDTGKKSSALASLGQFFSGGAAGVAQKLGSAAQRGINAYTSGVSRLVGGAAESAAGGLGRFVQNPGALGQQSGGAPLSQFTGQTRVIEGAPVAPGQRYIPPPSGPTFGTGTGKPNTTAGRSGYGIGGSSGSLAGGPVGRESMGDWTARIRRQFGGGSGRNVTNANVDAYNKAFKKANEANEARYQQLLSIADATTGQRSKDVTADFTNQQALAMQNLSGLGLANTSGASTIRGGFGRKKNEALDRLADQMQQTKLGIIERRQDLPPSLASLAAVSQLGITGLKFGS